MKWSKLSKFSKKDIPRLKRKLRTLVNSYVRARDGKCMVQASVFYKPQYGKCGGKLEASHLFAEQIAPSLRFDPENIITKCSFHHKFWWHKNPIEGTEWIKNHLGKEKYEILRIKARDKYIQWNIENLTKLIEYYKEKVVDE